MNEHIDIYCERLSPHFWAEPFNALTNIAFIIAAFFAYKLWRKEASDKKDILVLTIIAAFVGIGSFLFHTYAVFWAMLADVIPIAIFIYLSIWIFLRRIAGFSKPKSAFSLFAFFLLSGAIREIVPQDALNGSVEYIPAFIAIAVFSYYSKIREFVYAGITFFVSVTFRSLDMELCELTNGIGTHIFWHLLNGLVLYFVIRALIVGSKK